LRHLRCGARHLGRRRNDDPLVGAEDVQQADVVALKAGEAAARRVVRALLVAARVDEDAVHAQQRHDGRGLGAAALRAARQQQRGKHRVDGQRGHLGARGREAKV
jgi:hypothetical protein